MKPNKPTPASRPAAKARKMFVLYGNLYDVSGPVTKIIRTRGLTKAGASKGRRA